MESIPKIPSGFDVTSISEVNEEVITLRFHMKYIKSFNERADQILDYFKQYPTVSVDLSKKRLAILDCNFDNKIVSNKKKIVFLNDLVTDRINSSSLNLLVESLAFNRPVIYLNLNSNKICDVAIKYFSEGLMHNTQLKQLYLKNNIITDYGVKFLSECLKYNASINILDLSNNPFNYPGAKSLANGVKYNNSLEKIDLRDHNLDIKRIRSFIKLQYWKKKLAINML